MRKNTQIYYIFSRLLEEEADTLHFSMCLKRSVKISQTYELTVFTSNFDSNIKQRKMFYICTKFIHNIN